LTIFLDKSQTQLYQGFQTVALRKFINNKSKSTFSKAGQPVGFAGLNLLRNVESEQQRGKL